MDVERVESKTRDPKTLVVLVLVSVPGLVRGASAGAGAGAAHASMVLQFVLVPVGVVCVCAGARAL